MSAKGRPQPCPNCGRKRAWYPGLKPEMLCKSCASLKRWRGDDGLAAARDATPSDEPVQMYVAGNARDERIQTLALRGLTEEEISAKMGERRVRIIAAIGRMGLHAAHAMARIEHSQQRFRDYLETLSDAQRIDYGTYVANGFTRAEALQKIGGADPL